MITRLAVENFKSFRKLDVRLDRLNLLVGPNMAGKSNLLDIMRFLLSISKPNGTALRETIGARGGFGELVWKGSESPRLRILVEGRLYKAGEPIDYTYELQLLGSFQYANAGVEKESLIITKQGRRSELIATQGNSRTVNWSDGRQLAPMPDPNWLGIQYNLPDWEGSAIRDEFLGMRFYNFIPPLMRKANPSTAATFLTEYGDNLSSWLMTLQTIYQAQFARIQQVARDVLPGLQELFTSPTQQSTVSVASREQGLKRPTSILEMSDGELAFLGWLSLILAPSELSTDIYFVEEPENHLHPKLIAVIFELLRQVQAEFEANSTIPAQIFLTTHSPYVIDKCSIDELIVVHKRNGESLVSRPSDKAHLRKLFDEKEISLGDLYFSGALAIA